MELSRRVLGCLELFRGRYFDDDEAIRSYLLDSIQSIKQTTNSIQYNDESEEEMCMYGICVLLLQAAKYGLYYDELELDYVRQLGWDEAKQMVLGEVYKENRDTIREVFPRSTIPLPRLIDVECSLVSRQMMANWENADVDFTSNASFYQITFIYIDIDGTETSTSKVLNVIQLRKLIRAMEDALLRCDQLVEPIKKNE